MVSDQEHTGFSAGEDEFPQAQGTATVGITNGLNAYYALVSGLRKVIGSVLLRGAPMGKTHRLVYACIRACMHLYAHVYLSTAYSWPCAKHHL